ncbi:MAG: hypothetical protein DSM106950_42320 [Stigonema ocellatum SAG 48.90 = DSM 106950]|nr:hypothetical protein [Stigonema ocellatum SAG 48.90 = DSM 106950]
MDLSNLLEKELARWNDIISHRSNDPRAYVQRGMVNFKLVNINASITDFDTAEQLESRLTPYLWQRGLSYYYAERFGDGAKQFEVDLTVNAHDAEETIWRYLCIARLQSATYAGTTLLPIKDDPRLVMRRVYDLYAGNCSVDEVLSAGNSWDQGANFYSNLYVGLYFEAENKSEQARQYIVKAATQYQIDDYMWYLAKVHQKLRGWN